MDNEWVLMPRQATADMLEEIQLLPEYTARALQARYAALIEKAERQSVSGPLAELISGILWTARPDSGAAGMTLDSDEVALLAGCFAGIVKADAA